MTTIHRSRSRLGTIILAVALLATACGGGDSDADGPATSDESEAAPTTAARPALPAGCNNEEPLEVSFDGFREISGSFVIAGGVALPFAVLPGDGPLIDLTDDELQAAVDRSELRAYAVAVTDFPYGLDDAGSFYSLFSTPRLPDSGGTTIVLTVIPPEGPLAAGSVIEVGTELSYADELQTTAVSTGVFVESNVREDVPFIGGATNLFTGSAEVVALTDHAICLRWDTSSPVFGESEGFFTVKGTASAPLLPLNARNSMG